jgi:parvulin-like peptidyl-prolyl isomerase
MKGISILDKKAFGEIIKDQDITNIYKADYKDEVPLGIKNMPPTHAILLGECLLNEGKIHMLLIGTNGVRLGEVYEPISMPTEAVVSKNEPKESAEQKQNINEDTKVSYVVKVNDVVYTNEQLKEEMDGLPDYLKAVFAGSGGVNTFVEEVAKREVLTQEARKSGLDKDKAYTDRRADFEARFRTAGLKEYGKKLADFERNTLINMLLTKNIGEKVEKVKVTDEEVRDYYDKNPREFSVAKKVRASHILVKTEADSWDMIRRLRLGADFAELAKIVSMDTGLASNGGDLGYFARGEMLPEFEEAAFRLEKGVVSAPVKTKYGYHVIKVTDIKTNEVVEFDKVKQMIQQKLAGNKQKSAFEDYYSGIKKNHNVQVDQKALDEFKAIAFPAK